MALTELMLRIGGDSTGGVLAAARMSNSLRALGPQILKVNKNMQQLGPVTKLSMRGATQDMDKFSKGLKSTRFHSANLFAQINDIGVMMASGQSPFILAAQQGTQVTQVFNAMGGTAKQQFAALGRAALLMLKPMNLAVIGGIALAATLVQWGRSAISAGDNTDQLADDLKDLRSEIESTTLETQKLVMGLDSVAQVRISNQLETAKNTLAEMKRELSRMVGPAAMAATEMRAQVVAQEALVRELEEALANSIKAREEQQSFTVATKETAEAERLLGEQIQEVLRKTALLKLEMREARDAAMEAAREFMKVQEFRSRFAGEEILMGQDVLQPGRGTPAEELDKDKKKTGGAGRDPRADIERLQEQLMTELELEKKMYAEKQAIVDEALEKEFIQETQHQEMMEQLAERHAQAMIDIKRKEESAKLGMISGALSDVASLMNTENRKLFEIGKMAAIASATVSGYDAAVSAWDKGMGIGGPPVAAAFAGASLAKTGALIAGIKSTQFGGAGGNAAGAGGAAANTVAPPAASAPSRPNVSLTLIGNEGFSRAQIVQIAEALNDSGEDGNELVSIRGRR